jgi:hypothetical protein
VGRQIRQVLCCKEVIEQALGRIGGWEERASLAPGEVQVLCADQEEHGPHRVVQGRTRVGAQQGGQFRQLGGGEELQIANRKELHRDGHGFLLLVGLSAVVVVRHDIACECTMQYNCGMEKKQATSIRLSDEAKRLLLALANKSGISMTARLELMIREQAKRERVG